MFIHAYAYFCALLKCQKTKKYSPDIDVKYMIGHDDIHI